MLKAKDIPYVKIVIAGGVAYVGYRILKATGIIPTKVKKVGCKPGQLSSWELKWVDEVYDLDPAHYVKALDKCYRGVNLLPSPCDYLLRLLGENMTENDLNCVYNAWLKNIDANESIYTFLVYQQPYEGLEKYYMMQAIKRLTDVGLNK